MLQTLYIENIAVIEKTSIDFQNGLNVLTGETGAGKSIIIDAINAIMGQRTSKEIIRTGEQSAFVSAVFTDINEEAQKIISELGFEAEDGELVLQRTLSQSGKSSCKINGRPATVGMLRDIAKSLINIHGQHESYALFNPETHIDYIDSFGECAELLDAYRKEYKEYKKLRAMLDEADSDEGARLREIDLLSYQTNELFEAQVQSGEEEALSNERTVLMSFEKISSLLTQARMYLEGDENGGGIEAVDGAMSALQRAADLNPEYSAIADSIADVYYNLRDCAESVADAADSLESDPQRLEEIEERLDLLNRLSRKYDCPCDELADLAEKMQARLEQLLSYDKNHEELISQCSEAENRTKQAGLLLREKRLSTAKLFAARVKEEMSFLNMPNVEIVADFQECDFTSKGIDKAELLISANPGETPRPVAKIASGGELSRMMLAIKTVLASTDIIDTLIFDEVDTGISGSAAEKVGLKLKEVADSSQVLCVTHQAQIAALADNHYLIRKQVEGGRTFTGVSPLDHNGRVQELARIIGGVNITDAALSHAEDMLSQYNN